MGQLAGARAIVWRTREGGRPDRSDGSRLPDGAGRSRSATPVLFDMPRSLQKLADLTSDAAKQRVKLVVFPEAFIAGYPKGQDSGVSVGVRTPEGHDEFRRLFDSVFEVPGPATELLGS